MRIISSKDALEKGSALTIGVFDGVHVGHRALLSRVSDVAGSELERVVVTFDKHPLNVVAPARAPKMISTLKKKLELLEKTNLVDSALVIEFNPIRAAQSAEDFVKEVLVEKLNVKKILIGENFVFGHERRGNFELLKTMGEEYGFDVESIELVEATQDFVASSTLIRQYVSVGEVSKAKHLLGRPHEITGVVEGGDKVGTDLGYPTANTFVDEIIAVPSDGVYSGRVWLPNGMVYKSAISIGVRPMFHEDNIRVIEPHLLDFEGNIYGQEITIEFEERLRDQQVFDTVEDLVAQIDKDVKYVRETVKI